MNNENGLPTDWRDRIRNKKVILYVSSVSSLLSFEKIRIKKMKTIFELVKQKDDIVLWWRPHPLEFATLKSMRPDLVEEYISLKTEFQKEKIGILDESGNPDIAMVIADAYYGESGSMIHLFKATGKPIFKISYNVEKTEKKFQLRVSDLCVFDNKAYLASHLYNSIVVMNMSDFQVEEVIKIPYNYPFLYKNAYSLYLYEKKIYIYGRNCFYCYDIQKDKFDELNYEKISELKIVLDELESEQGVITKYTINSYNDLPRNPLLKHYCKEIGIGKENTYYWGMIGVNHYFIMPHLTEPIITIWDLQTKESYEIKEYPENFIWKGQNSFSDMIVDGEDVIIFPKSSNMILRINPLSKKITEFVEVDLGKSGVSITCAKKYEEKLYVFMCDQMKVIVYDLKSRDMSEKEILINPQICEEILAENMLEKRNNEEIVNFCNSEQAVCFSIEKFLKDLQEYSSVQALKNSRKSLIGQTIHDEIKGVMKYE